MELPTALIAISKIYLLEIGSYIIYLTHLVFGDTMPTEALSIRFEAFKSKPSEGDASVFYQNTVSKVLFLE